MNLFERARDGVAAGLQSLAASAWAHEFLALIGALVVTAWPARLLARRFEDVHPETTSRPEKILRRWVQVTLWPVLAMGLAALVLELPWSSTREFFGDSRRVLAILVFWMVYRWIDLGICEVVVDSTHRRRVRRVVLPLLFTLLVLQQLALLVAFVQVLQRPLLPFGKSGLTTMDLILSLSLAFGSLFAARAAFELVGHQFLPRFGIDRALSEAVATVLRYLLVVMGLLWALEVLGFDLTTLKIGLGALGVGIGFGLQNIVNNFTSGLILLFERSVKRGDILTVEGTDGRVEQVGLRASVLRTRKGDDLILPNSMLVENMVTNYSYRDDLQRVDVNVGVSYNADPHRVREILLQVAHDCDAVLKNPPATVLFTDFGESSIDFQLRSWIDDAWKHPQVRSELLFAIWDALKAEGIEIPYPQRDLHLRGGWESVPAPPSPIASASNDPEPPERTP